MHVYIVTPYHANVLQIMHKAPYFLVIWSALAVQPNVDVIHAWHLLSLVTFHEYHAVQMNVYVKFGITSMWRCVVLLSTGSGRHSDAAHEIRLIGCCVLLKVVPKKCSTLRLFPDAFDRLAPLEAMHLFYLSFNYYSKGNFRGI